MDLKVKILGMTFENPLLPASGPNVGSLKALQFMNQTMTGALVTKTISVKGAEVNKPCIIANDYLVHNTELWSEFDHQVWVEELLPKLKADLKKPLIIGVGYSSDDYKTLMPKLNPFADAFEVSTHYGKDNLRALVSSICALTDKPVLIKLSPHIEDYIGFVRVAIESGASGIVAINSLGPGVHIDLRHKSVSIGSKSGRSWISGPAIKAVALERVMTIRRYFPDIPLVACGGVESASDLLEFILAGADLVQLLSGALIRGRQIYDQVVLDLPDEMKKYGLESITSLRQTSLSLKPFGKANLPVITGACIGCYRCKNICPVLAIGEDLRVDGAECLRCGLCASRCPVQAIEGVLS